ncbi:HIG1 domain family member 2A, mitochondrial isoform X2 [Chelonia mydas]|uniref:HIG1 domain family member 2A, mitochondrial isoform X2 n=1 Tax=Chelonia mydas TaxID=8469 RepID=UPI001CA90282|nr:HIG1 domain family member 2A, mitochondrial isoform X2 [Chelonia mydas]
MAQSSPPPFDPSSPPLIEGFLPTPLHREGFREKFLRKTRENPLVPIERQYPPVPADDAGPYPGSGLHHCCHHGGGGGHSNESSEVRSGWR